MTRFPSSTRPQSKAPLDIRPHPNSPNTRVTRFKNGRPNLRATFQSLAPQQSLTVRHPRINESIPLIRFAARDARIRIRIHQHPALNTIAVTCIGPCRKKLPQLERIAKINRIDPTLRLPRGPRFQGWRGTDIFS